MKLNIVDEKDHSIAVSLGISQDRYNELMHLASEIEQTGTITQRTGRIAEFCNNLEEYTLVMIQDIRWLIKTGVMPIELTDEAKAKFAEHIRESFVNQP